MSVGLEEEKLHRYFDGDLPESEAEEVRQALEQSEEDRARLEQLERLRGLIAMAAEQTAADLESDSLFDRIRTGIDEKKEAGYHEPFRVVEGEKKDAPAPRRHGVETWRVWGPTAAVAAVAAAVLLFFWAAQDPKQAPTAGTDVEPEQDTAPSEVEIEESAVATIEPPQGSEVEEVDFGGNTGTVFAVQGDAGEPIAVVWINDEPMDQVTQ